MFARSSLFRGGRRGSLAGFSHGSGPFPRSRRLVLEPLEDRRLLAAGDLDVSFDSDGLVTSDLGGYDYAWAVAVQDDGGVEKIVVAGTSGGDFALARYLPDGSLDTSFGTSGTGIVTTDIGSDSDHGSDVAVDSNGKIVVAGYTNASGTNSVFAVARYNTDGSLDSTFDADGDQDGTL